MNRVLDLQSKMPKKKRKPSAILAKTAAAAVPVAPARLAFQTDPFGWLLENFKEKRAAMQQDRVVSEEFSRCGRRWYELRCSAVDIELRRRLFLMLNDKRAPEHLSIFLEALDHQAAIIKFRVDACNFESKIFAHRRERYSSRRTNFC